MQKHEWALADNKKMLNLIDNWENARQKETPFFTNYISKKVYYQDTFIHCEKCKLAGLPERAICQYLFASRI